MQARVPTEEFLQWLAFVSGRIVQQYDYLAPQMPEQVAQEEANFRLRNIVVEEEVVEAQSLPLWADRNTRNDRNLIPPTGVMNNRSFAHRRPGLGHVRDEQETGLVNEYYVGAQPSGFFLMPGHFCRFHCSIAASLRSKARRSGF